MIEITTFVFRNTYNQGYLGHSGLFGKIDDARVYDKTIDATEIKRLESLPLIKKRPVIVKETGGILDLLDHKSV